LVIFTWGNVSELEDGIVAIKPSGLEYDKLTPDDIVLTDLAGKTVEGKWKPSSDLHTHLEIYRSFSGIYGVTHTHSQWATSWAQAGLAISALGTTHADYFYGDIPCTRALTEAEIRDDYELNTGKAIVETFAETDAAMIPGVLVKHHGPFAWGKDAADSVHNAVVMEQCAKMAYASKLLADGGTERIPQALLDRHYLRKHGKDAYYGQHF